MKYCNKCSTEKELTQFHKDKSTKDGLSAGCKLCRRASTSKWQKDNVTHRTKYRKQYVVANSDKCKLIDKKYRENHKDILYEKNKIWKSQNEDKVREYGRNWGKANRAKCLYHVNRYRAAKLSATPSWLTEVHLEEIKQIYLDSEYLTLLTKTPFEVDHIAPLQGATSCGLHVPWNLQLLPRTENRQKSNSI
jgi:hypothetical protein